MLPLIVVWSIGSGSSFVFIRGAHHGLGPLVAICLALWIGAGVLRLAWRATGAPRVSLGPRLRRRQWLVAVLTTSLTYTLISWGEQHVSATTTLIVLATIPIIGAGIARMRPPHERLSRPALAGLAIGLAGVVVVAGEPGRSELLGLLAIILASGVFGACLVLAKAFAHDAVDQPDIALSARHITMAAVALTPPALLEALLSRQHPSVENLAYVAGLGVIGYGFVYVMFYLLLRRTTVAHASMSAYLQPISGTVLAWLVLGEDIVVRQVAGAVVILCGVAIVDAARRRDLRLSPLPGAELSPAAPPR